MKTVSGNKVVVDEIWGNRILGSFVCSGKTINMVWFRSSGKCCTGKNPEFNLDLS